MFSLVHFLIHLNQSSIWPIAITYLLSIICCLSIILILSTSSKTTWPILAIFGCIRRILGWHYQNPTTRTCERIGQLHVHVSVLDNYMYMWVYWTTTRTCERIGQLHVHVSVLDNYTYMWAYWTTTCTCERIGQLHIHVSVLDNYTYMGAYWTTTRTCERIGQLHIHVSVLVKYKAGIFISSNVTPSHHDTAEKLFIWCLATITLLLLFSLIIQSFKT